MGAFTFGFAKKWCISLEKGLDTTYCITQHGVHTLLHPIISWWFRMNNCQLTFRILPHNVYSDEMLASTVSRRDNK